MNVLQIVCRNSRVFLEDGIMQLSQSVKLKQKQSLVMATIAASDQVTAIVEFGAWPASSTTGG